LNTRRLYVYWTRAFVYSTSTAYPWIQRVIIHISHLYSTSHYPQLILIAFITANSSLEPLIEGLCAQIHVNLRWRVFGRNRTGGLTDYYISWVPRSPPLSYGDRWITENPLGPSLSHLYSTSHYPHLWSVFNECAFKSITPWIHGLLEYTYSLSKLGRHYPHLWSRSGSRSCSWGYVAA